MEKATENDHCSTLLDSIAEGVLCSRHKHNMSMVDDL